MVATLPTQYPFPVAPGGLLRAQAIRSLRSPPQFDVRQPDLKQAALVQGVIGFGSGAGAFIRNNGSDADQSQGVVVIRCGLSPLGVGTIGLSFPAGVTAGLYAYFADWADLVPAAPATPIQQIAWTATRNLGSNEVLHMAYQWAVST